jgi:GDPmannose 4,6-dehydratase
LGVSGDYVRAMREMLRQSEPDDYVLATGKTRTMREFIAKAAGFLNFDLLWRGQGAEEVGVDSNTGRILVEVDRQYYRPIDIDCSLGNAQKAGNKLGWQPTTPFDELVEMMVRMDYDRLKRA